MTELHTSDASYWGAVLRDAHKADRVDISTFNLYAGILDDGRDVTAWGPKYYNPAHDLLSRCQANGTKTRVMFCVPQEQGKACGCECCTERRNKAIARIDKHMERWPGVEWLKTNESHMKLIVIEKDGEVVAWSGGRNLSPSDWVDLSFRFEGQMAKDLDNAFRSAWRRSLVKNRMPLL